jgi:hypothetical protein
MEIKRQDVKIIHSDKSIIQVWGPPTESSHTLRTSITDPQQY